MSTPRRWGKAGQRLTPQEQAHSLLCGMTEAQIAEWRRDQHPEEI